MRLISIIMGLSARPSAINPFPHTHISAAIRLPAPNGRKPGPMQMLGHFVASASSQTNAPLIGNRPEIDWLSGLSGFPLVALRPFNWPFLAAGMARSGLAWPGPNTRTSGPHRSIACHCLAQFFKFTANELHLLPPHLLLLLLLLFGCGFNYDSSLLC